MQGVLNLNSVKQWSTIVCASALLGSLVELITPSGKMEKIMRFVFGAFMICSILIPFSKMARNISFNVDFNDTSYNSSSKVSEEIQNNFNNLVSEKVEKISEDLLIKNDIKYKKIQVIMDTNEDSGISIIKNYVVIDKRDAIKSDLIKKIIKENLGIETEVSFS